MTTSQVTTELVSFASDGVQLRGELFLAADGHGRGKLPAVVVTGTWTSVRQQMAARGFAALSFIPDGARRFHAALGVDKDIAWTAGTQFDFYDQRTVISDAADRAATHFERYV